MSLLFLLLAVPPRYPPHEAFYYRSPTTNRTLSMCVCPKCGSSSMYQALFAAIANRTWDRPQPIEFGVHKFMRWGKGGTPLTGLTQSKQPADVQVIVIRDPIARYLWAFRSKVACCPKVGRLSPQPCFRDKDEWKRIPLLLRLARIGTRRYRKNARCLSLDDFALTLHAVHKRGAQASVDEHFRPQQLHCLPVLGKNGVLLRGTISELKPALAELTGYQFAGGRIRVEILHASTAQIKANPLQATLAGISTTARGALCSLSRLEYRALNISLPRECAL
ncbi:hypothetical protein T492DRAFT_1084055 [Pavlovales sp. CCMP2436]|nr:hypothetical protein T492DRAFT_1084055 [Pavlovales sp. CCMP2436]